MIQDNRSVIQVFNRNFFLNTIKSEFFIEMGNQKYDIDKIDKHDFE